jgi:hypothetical protein
MLRLRMVTALLLALGFAHGADLETLFKQAEKDSEALVPLIEAGSAQAAKLPPQQALALCERLSPFARKLFFSTVRTQNMQRVGLITHVIAKGENPTTIAKRYRITFDLLPRLNENYKVSSLQVGQELKVLDCSSVPLRLSVDVGQYRLAAWRGDILLASFPVGLGASDKPTPTGDTTIKLRVRDPEWTNPDSKEAIAGNDPRNVLGGYWLGFDPLEDRTFAGIGIHGYTGEAVANWISKPGSHGCVRMLQDDIKLMYDLVATGTKVSLKK